MRARTANSTFSPTSSSPAGTDPRLFRGLFRCGLGLAGLWWICCAGILCGCNSVNGYVMNESGKSYYNRGDFAAARHEFERAAMDSPHNANYAYNVAAAMQEQGDIMAAERMYQHAITLDPAHQPSYQGLAHLLNSQGRSAEAEQLLTGWSETQPYMPDANLSLARMQQNRGDYAAAEQTLQKALAVNPRHRKANAELGMVYRRQGRNQEAAAMYGRAMSLNPYDTDVQAEVIALNQSQGNMDPALMMAQQMSQYDPTMQGGAMPYGAVGTTAPYVGSSIAATNSPPSIYPRMYGPAVGRSVGPSLSWGTPATVAMPGTMQSPNQQGMAQAGNAGWAQNGMALSQAGASQNGFFQAMPSAQAPMMASPMPGSTGSAAYGTPSPVPTLASPPQAGPTPASYVAPASYQNMGGVPAPAPPVVSAF
jgi:tetratricopeptide (TPR) repeat protein